jgi:hypothetical protein
MRFGSGNVSSLRVVAEEISKYKLDLLGVQLQVFGRKRTEKMKYILNPVHFFRKSYGLRNNLTKENEYFLTCLFNNDTIDSHEYC